MSDETTARSAAASTDKSDSTDQIGDLTTAFARLAEMGPSVMEFHKALVDGLVRSGEIEAKRLAALDETDPLIEVVTRRTEQMVQFRQALTNSYELAGRLAGIVGASRMLQGYVTHEDGSAAVGFTVRIARDKGARTQPSRQAKAITDDMGYFRIQLDLSNDVPAPHDNSAEAVGGAKTSGMSNRSDTGRPTIIKAGPTTLSALAARISRPADPPASATTATGEASPGSHDSASANDGSDDMAMQIDVLNPSGVQVFRDPAPPSFSNMAMSFRYYVLPSARGPKSVA